MKQVFLSKASKVFFFSIALHNNNELYEGLIFEMDRHKFSNCENFNYDENYYSVESIWKQSSKSYTRSIFVEIICRGSLDQKVIFYVYPYVSFP